MLIAIPQGVWAEDYPIMVAGVQVTSENASNVLGDQETPTVVFTPAVNTNPATLTLNGATLEGTIVSSLSALTIHLEGENTLNGFISTEGDNNTLTFTYSGNSSLTISSEETIISGFSDVNFGDLNLASNTPGVYYNDIDYFMAGPAGNPSDLTITTETYYPIWIYDPESDYGHTQLRGASEIETGEGTVSFDGDHTITISNVNFNYEDGTMIFVGPSMTELTVSLEGTSSIEYNRTGLNLWKSTPLTFTTNASTPGSLTGYGIVSWNGSGNEQISYGNGLVSNNITDNKVVIAKLYNLWVNGTQVTSANSQDILSDDATYKNNKISFDGDHTLTLHNIPGTVFDTQVPFIKNGIENLTIFLDGQNEVNCGVFIEKETDGGDNFTATFVTDSNAPGLLAIISNTEEWYTGHTLEYTDPLLLNPTGYTYTTAPKALYATTYAEYNLTIAGIPVTSANAGGVTGEGITTETNGTVTYNATDKILTLTNVSLSTSKTNPLIICNGDLTVNLVGKDNNTYFNNCAETYIFKNNGTTGTLTFKGTGILGLNSSYSAGTYKGLCDGFTEVEFNDDLGLFNQADTKYVKNITGEAPGFYLSNGVNNWAAENGLLLNATYHYKIDYVDTSIEGSGVEVDLLLDQTNYNFNGATLDISDLTPCTITSYAKMNGNIIGSKKAKLFGPAAETQRIVCGEASSLALAPAIEEGDGIKINGIDSAIEFDKETQKITASGLGSGTLYVSLQYVDEEYKPGNTIILNSESLQMQVEVVRDLGIEFVGTNSWASYYATETLAVPEGLTAYVVSSVNEETGAVTVASIEYIPANNAVLLKREQNGAANGYTAGEYTGNTTQVTNLLVGSAEATEISSIANSPVYVLFNDKFKRAISGTIPARRAYLPLGAAVVPSGAPQFMNINIGDGSVTAIKTLSVDDKNDSWYTIDGLKLNGKPQRKGIYINNGKKKYINNNK